MIEVDVSLMRGGTSKGVFLAMGDLPVDLGARDEFALRLMGTPDPMQIDGLGGTHSSTSKIVAVEARPGTRGLEVAYLFAQVGVDRPVVDWSGNCGNLTAAVGPYALYEGLVDGDDPLTEVALVNLNTNRRITARVPTRDGVPLATGGFSIAGVPGTGAPIALEWHEPGGTVTGEPLPTGSPTDRITTSWGSVVVSVVDVSGPYVFVDASSFGLTGAEDSAQLNRDEELIAKLVELRAIVAERLGLAPSGRADIDSPAIPRVALVGVPALYVAASGERVAAGDYDLSARALSMGSMHHAFPGTGLLSLAAAGAIPGTVPFDLGHPSSGPLRVGHNKGVAVVTARVAIEAGRVHVSSVTTLRTARRLLRGTAALDID